MGRSPLRVHHPIRLRLAQSHRQIPHLRRALQQSGRASLPGARRRPAQRPERLHHHWQVADRRRHPLHHQRQAALRHRCLAAGHALCVDREVPGLWRQGQNRQRRPGKANAGRAPGPGDRRHHQGRTLHAARAGHGTRHRHCGRLLVAGAEGAQGLKGRVGQRPCANPKQRKLPEAGCGPAAGAAGQHRPHLWRRGRAR